MTGIGATVDRQEGGWAILRTDDGQELRVAGKLLPRGTHEGARLIVSFKLDLLSARARRQQASKLIANIIKRQHARQ